MKQQILIILFISTITLLFGQEEDSMHYILDNLYLGDVLAAENETYLKSFNISIVINCAYEHISEYEDLKAYELKLTDHFPQELFPTFETAYEIIKQYNQERKIFIHCMSGVSRSASLVIFYIMKEKKWDYDKSFEYVRNIRTFIDPNTYFVQQLKEYYEKYIK